MAAEPRVVALLRVLDRHGVDYVVIGAQAAVAAGAPLVTADLDITPARDEANLERLSAALRELGARLRTPSDPAGVPFPVEPEMLATATLWTLTTRLGDLDLVFEPSGTSGFGDLRRDARRLEVADGLSVLVASLLDVIRTKQATGRAKDLAQLPLLRQTLEEIRRHERQAR